MQVRRIAVIVLARLAPEIIHWHAISTLIVVGNGVQRLVQIAHEVNDVAERLGSLRSVPILVLQNSELVLDGLRDATLFPAEIAERRALGSARNVDVMPRPVFRRAANIVRP